MTTTTPLTAGLFALALATSACTAKFTTGTNAPAAEAGKTAAAAAAPKTARNKVPDPPKTPAAKTEAKPAKAEAVPENLRVAPTAPDSWDVITDNEYGIQFRVPTQWDAGTSKTEDGTNVFVAAAPDQSMLLSVMNFQGSDGGDEDLLGGMIDGLGFQVDGQYERLADGLIVAHGTGTNDGQPIVFVAMVYAVDDMNYMSYIVTPASQAERNKTTMRQILESFELV